MCDNDNEDLDMLEYAMHAQQKKCRRSVWVVGLPLS